MARKRAKRKPATIGNKDTEISEGSELLHLKCEEISVDDDEPMPTATKGFENNFSRHDGKINQTETEESSEASEDVDVKPDVTLLENTTQKNKSETHHIAIISTENRPIVFEKVKAETSDNDDSDNSGSSDDESENLGAVLTDEEVMSSKEEQDWEPDSSDSSSAAEDDENSDASWTDGKSKTKKITRKNETVKEATATKPSKRMKKCKKATGDYKGFICHYCEKRFRDIKDLKRHRMSRHEKKNCPHKCPLCKFVSAYRADLIRHLKNIHQLVQTEEGDYIEVPREALTALPERKHTCDVCGYKARWNAHLVRHQLTKHSEAKSFKCTFPGCNRSYKLEDHLRRHAKHHLLRSKEFAENAEDPWWRSLASEVPELIKCPEPECYFETYCVGDLRVHSIAHSEEKKYVCDYPGCDYRSKWLRPLQEHELIHYPERGLACPVDGCEFRTACKRRLDYHGQSHSKNPSFPCDQEDCNFRGKTQESLRAHRRLVHKVNANYHCPHCPKRFCLPRTLHIHVKSHEANDGSRKGQTGRHQCPECSKVCINAYNLSLHMKKHAKETQELKGKRHECPECSKVCKNAYHLRSHMRKHAEKKEKELQVKHECPECSKVCSTAYNLSSHMRVHLNKKQNGPEGQRRKRHRKQVETVDVDAEEIEDPVVIKLEDEIKSELAQNNAPSLDTTAITQVVQASVSDTCALLREIITDS